MQSYSNWSFSHLHFTQCFFKILILTYKVGLWFQNCICLVHKPALKASAHRVCFLLPWISWQWPCYNIWHVLAFIYLLAPTVNAGTFLYFAVNNPYRWKKNKKKGERKRETKVAVKIFSINTNSFSNRPDSFLPATGRCPFDYVSVYQEVYNQMMR